jgi:hypothetical protein
MSGSIEPESVGRGLWLVMTGKPEGIACFRGTARAFFVSLTPMLGFSLMAVMLLWQHGQRHNALEQLLSTPVGILAAPVVSHFLSLRFDREARWARYATAVNWCQWGYLPLFLVVMTLWTAGSAIAPMLALIVVVYAVWMQLFLARYGLALEWPRAIAVVAAVVIANFLLVLVPSLLGPALTRTVP